MPCNNITSAPGCYKHMIAAYAIGYSITKDDIKKFPHMKFTNDETDTGVIVTNAKSSSDARRSSKNIR